MMENVQDIRLIVEAIDDDLADRNLKEMTLEEQMELVLSHETLLL